MAAAAVKEPGCLLSAAGSQALVAGFLSEGSLGGVAQRFAVGPFGRGSGLLGRLVAALLVGCFLSGG